MTIKVHFFKATGKWYTTEDVPVMFEPGGIAIREFREALRVHLGGRLQGMIAVTTDEKAPFPLATNVGEVNALARLVQD